MQIQTLDPQLHRREHFDCGNEALNRFLKQMANQQAERDLARTYVLAEPTSGQIIGFYTLTMTPLELAELPESFARKIKRPISAGLIARLAVDKQFQGRGYAKTLLFHALSMLYQASRLSGFPIIIVDAKNGVEAFYEQFGFIRIQQTPNRFYLTIPTLAKLVQS